MKNGVVGGLILGLALGAGLMVVVRRAPSAPPANPPATEPTRDPMSVPAYKKAIEDDNRILALEEENRKLREEIAELKKPKPAAAEPDKPSAEAPLDKDFAERFAKLGKEGLGALFKPELADVLAKLKAAGKEGVAFVLKALKSESPGERFLAVTMLMSLNDTSAAPAAIEALRGDRDLLVRRQAAHAVGTLWTDASAGALREAMNGDKDWGVKANSAYWLAKHGQDDGLRVLEQTYTSPDTAPEYRMAVLGGLADVASPATAPLFRKILGEAKEETYLLLAIMALEKMKDPEALPGLRRIETSDAADSIKEAARKAVAAIGN